MNPVTQNEFCTVYLGSNTTTTVSTNKGLPNLKRGKLKRKACKLQNVRDSCRNHNRFM